MTRKFIFTSAKGGAAFTVRVVTRSAATEMVGIQEDGSLKVRLMASPAGDPAANQELVNLLSSKLNIPKDKIEIVAGVDGRDKIVSIVGITAEEVEAKLSAG